MRAETNARLIIDGISKAGSEMLVTTAAKARIGLELEVTFIRFRMGAAMLHTIKGKILIWSRIDARSCAV